ncbi:MAG: hypothetical protein ACLUD0_05570 [Eubacterium ramulus]
MGNNGPVDRITVTVLWLISFGGKIAGFTGHFDIMVVGFVVLLLISIFWLRDDPEDKGCFPDNEKTMTREMAQKIHEKGMEYKKTSPWTIKKLLTNRQGLADWSRSRWIEYAYRQFGDESVDSVYYVTWI